MGARLLRAIAGCAPPGTSIFGRAARVRDGLGCRLASGRRRPEHLHTSRRIAPARPRAELDAGLADDEGGT
jgi:hypothetical protein